MSDRVYRGRVAFFVYLDEQLNSLVEEESCFISKLCPLHSSFLLLLFSFCPLLTLCVDQINRITESK